MNERPDYHREQWFSTLTSMLLFVGACFLACLPGLHQGGGRAKGRGGGGRGGKAHDIADDDDDSDFEFGARAKKKSSKAQNVAAPPPLPTRAVVPPLVSSHSGGKVP